MRACVEDVRGRLARLRVALTSANPQDLAAAAPELEDAVAMVAELERKCAQGAAPEAGLSRDLAGLARDLAIVERLLDRGRELCNARAILVATAAGGYGASGKPAALRPGSSIAIEG
jgi:hypothetical protein